MQVDTKSPFDRAFVRSYSEQHGEPSWLLESRLHALELSQTLPLPRLEKTKIDGWNMSDFRFPSAQQGLLAEQLPAEVRYIAEKGKSQANIIVHRDGHPVYEQMTGDLQHQHVIFTDIRTAFREHGQLIRRYFMQQFKADQHKLAAIHAALVNCGIFLYVPRNQEVTVPVQGIFWHSMNGAGLVPHVLIVAEENSKVTYVENNFGDDAAQGVNHYVAEVFVGAGAHVNFAAVDHFGQHMTNYVYRQALVENDGSIDWALGQMHSGHTVTDNTTVLKGNGARSDSKSVAVGRGEQSLNFVQKVIQHGWHTDGQMLGHAVMKDKARAIFNGITKIEKGATKSNGEQTERVLMLSDQARGDANPILLIDEDDVTAGHAASVGQVDKNQLYYLMSRGISREEAERLIILGFLYPVVEKIPVKDIQERLIEVIERKVKS